MLGINLDFQLDRPGCFLAVAVRPASRRNTTVATLSVRVPRSVSIRKLKKGPLAMNPFVVLGLGWVCFMLFFSPTIIASHRKVHNFAGIFAMNLILGLTGIGWLIALLLALCTRSGRLPPGTVYFEGVAYTRDPYELHAQKGPPT
jgi:hypothetical protein